MTCGIFVGLSTIDLIHTVDEFPEANTKAVAYSQEVLLGGPATNAAITFSYLGGTATLVTAVGRHSLATMVKDELQRYAISLIDLTPESEEPPPISSVWVNQRGQRSIVSVNAARSRIPPPKVNSSKLQEADVLLVDGHLMAACQVWAEAARAAEISAIFDGGSWKPGTEKLLTFVDTAICSADFRPPGCASEGEVVQHLQVAGARHIAITRGSNPVQFVSGSNQGSLEVPQVEVKDTAGAGDIFHGAFCYYASRGLEFMDSLRRASAIAAESCRFHGTREWMRARCGSQL